MKVKVSDSLGNAPNKNIVTIGDQQTDQLNDKLLEWLFATTNEWRTCNQLILCSPFNVHQIVSFLISPTEQLIVSLKPKTFQFVHIKAWCRIKREVDWELHIWETSRLIRHCGLAQIKLESSYPYICLNLFSEKSVLNIDNCEDNGYHEEDQLKSWIHVSKNWVQYCGTKRI